MGRTIPAVDKAATVPDPKQIRKITATAHESRIGEIVTPLKRPAMYSPTPPSIITCLNAPPPPVIKINKPIALMDAPAEAVKSFIGIFLAIPIVYIANTSEINKATGAFPTNRMIWLLKDYRQIPIVFGKYLKRLQKTSIESGIRLLRH